MTRLKFERGITLLRTCRNISIIAATRFGDILCYDR